MFPARLFVIAAPSGAGKTSLVKALIECTPNLQVSISHTTRRRRPNEREGEHYHFVTRERFAELKAAGVFLEDAEVFDNHYGTSREGVERALAAGHDVLLEIDWQGARQVRARMPECETIFILPPSHAELAARLFKRGTDDEAVIARRLRDAEADISHWQEFDYVVVNDDFGQALEALSRIVGRDGAAWRADRPGLADLVAGLMDHVV
ncbi:MAG: guanylate kinase [Steroidobacteraceae bacterium]